MEITISIDGSDKHLLNVKNNSKIYDVINHANDLYARHKVKIDNAIINVNGRCLGCGINRIMWDKKNDTFETIGFLDEDKVDITINVPMMSITFSPSYKKSQREADRNSYYERHYETDDNGGKWWITNG